MGSSTRAAVQALVGELGRRAGIAGLALDAAGMVALQVDGRLVLHEAVEEDEEGSALLYVPVGGLPGQGRERLLRRLLEANLAGRGDTVVGLHGASERVVLLAAFRPATADWAGFERLVEGLLARAEELAAEIAAEGGGAADEGGAISDLRLMSMGLRA